MKNLLITLFAAFLLTGCTDPTKAIEVLEAQGFKNIQITGYNFFSCGKDDTYHTGFTATSQAGTSVSGTVCAGLLFKGSTVRFE